MAFRSVVAHTLLLFGSLLAAFSSLEVSLRILYPPPVRFLYPQESYDFDPEIGHMLRPQQDAFTHDRPVRTDSLGLRDREITREPAPGTLRVLALGDSQTFGNGLDLADTWPKQLERMLRETATPRWEVLNAGVPGTDTWQHEILLKRLFEHVNPDAVVLAVYANDVVPRFVPQRVDGSAPTNTWDKRLVYLLKRSAVVTWTYYRLFLPWQARRSEWATATEEAVLAGRADARAERGWQQVEQSLAAMKAFCDARGATLFVAILPRRDQVSGAHPGRAYSERTRALASRYGIATLDLLPALSTEFRIKGEALFIPWDGHNSAAANRVIAAGLVERLADLAPRVSKRRSLN